MTGTRVHGKHWLDRPSRSPRVEDIQLWWSRERFNAAVILAKAELMVRGEHAPTRKLAQLMEISESMLRVYRTREALPDGVRIIWIDAALRQLIGAGWMDIVNQAMTRPHEAATDLF